MKRTLFLLLCVLTLCLCATVAMAEESDTTCTSHVWDYETYGGYDANYHWYVCKNCNARHSSNYYHYKDCLTGACTGCGATDVSFYSTNHSSVDYNTYYHDDDSHWIQCSCGQKFNDYVHYMDCATGACEDCGETDVTFYGTTHTVTDYTYMYDDTHCWYECSECGGRASEQEHYVYCSNGEECYRCGATDVTFASRYHSWDYDNYGGYDDTYHWRLCKYCGEADISKYYHYMDCATGACTRCGQTDVSFNSTSHTAVDYNTYYHDDDSHWYACGCGEKINDYVHYMDCATGACEDCGATDVTFYGTAHNVADYTYKYDDTHCWYECSECGSRVDEGEHYVYCSNGEECYRCGATDVTFAFRSHSWDYETYGGHDDTYHWHLCKYCGEGRNSKYYHYQDCMTGACTGCGATDVNFYSTSHTAVDYNTYYHDDDSHWVQCGCGETINDSYHFADCGTGACTDCGATDVTFYGTSHTVTDHTYKHDDTHCWYECSVCGGRTNEQEHYVYCYYGEECYRCGATDVTFASRSHSWNYDSYEYDDVYHWRLCNYCGEPQSWKNNHSIDCATGACSACGVTEYDADRVSYSHNWDWDNYCFDNAFCWVECSNPDCDAYTNYSTHYTSCSSETGACINCGQTDVTIGRISHNWDRNNYFHDDNYCWYACADCGEVNSRWEHEIDCVTGECYRCGQTGVNGYVSHNYKVELKYDNEKHWEVCLGCGEICWEAEHDVYCVSGVCSYCEASGVTGDPIHEYDYDDRKYDDTYCWNVCDGCGEILRKWEHEKDCVTGACSDCGQSNVAGDVYHYNYSSTWQYNEEEHWRVCDGCGGIRDEAEPHYVNCLTGVCNSCDAENVTGRPSHSYDSRVWGHDESYCWRVCKGCNEEIYKYRHDVDCQTGVCDRCGETGVTGDVSHTVDWDTYQHDDKYHWNPCMYCGAVMYKSRHEVDCNAESLTTCEECYATDVVCRLDHETENSDPLYNANYHWWICDHCDSVMGKENHYIDCQDGTCYGCGMTGVSGYVEHYWDWDDVVFDENYHWWICEECGEVANKGRHWLDCVTGKCRECEADGVNGEIDHEYDESTWQYDDNSCWMVCPNCDEIHQYDPHYVDCTTGICDRCGQSDVNGYISHTYDWPNYEYNEIAHWMVCESCGEIGNYGQHAPSCTTGACAECGLEDVTGRVEHTWDINTVAYDQNYHWMTCPDCGEVYNKSEHYENCATGACDFCNQKDVTFEWVNHDTYGTPYQYNDEQHWQVCRACGENQYSDHYLSCVTGKCRGCGQGDVDGYEEHYCENWNLWAFDKDSHWRICDECGEKIDENTHNLSCETGLCLQCGQKNVKGNIGHNWKSGVSFDTTAHWSECSDCGATGKRYPHLLDCASGLCTSCQQSEVQGTKWHRGGNEWHYDESECWATCSRCGEEQYRDVHAVSCETGKCIYCDQINVTGVVGHHFNEKMDYDQNSHWLVCDYCGAENEHFEHYTNCDSTKDACSYCEASDVTINKTNHRVVLAGRFFDATQHWTTCYYCDEKVLVEKHTVEADGKCECGFTSALYITSQPVSVTVEEGVKARVTVQAVGEGLTYAWYYKSADASSFTLTNAFKSNSYFVEMNEARDGRQVYCIITDANGNQVVSNTATLSMVKPLTLAITKQPVSVSVDVGETATVTVGAQGEGLTYAWYYKSAGSSKFNLSTSYKSNEYAIEMTESRNGRQLYCVVTDQYGNSVQTNTVTIGIARTELKIIKQPVNVSAKEGEKATVVVAAQGDGLTYTWYYKNAGSSKFNLSSSFTSNVYSIEMNEARDGREIYCVVSDQYGNSVQSNTATISIARTKLRITKQPADVTVEDGERATVTVEAQGDGLTYAWYYKSAGASKFTLTTSFTSNSYFVSMTESRDGRQVYCVITDKYGNSVTTKTVTLNLKKPTELMILQQPESVAVEAGQTAAITVVAQGDGLTYAWYYKNATSSKFVKSSTTTDTYSFEMNESRAGREVYCVITDQYGNSVTTDTATMNMVIPKTELKITQQPVSVTVDEGERATVTVEAQGDGLTYAWYYKSAGASKFTLTTSFTGNSYFVSMTESRDGREVYCVITDQYGDSVTTETVTLSMTKPTELKITQQPESVAVEAGETAAITVVAQGDGLTYAWYYKNATSSKFVKSSTTTNTYSFEMNESRAGREVYCVITDQYGNSVTTDTATMNMVIPKTELKITQQPVSVTVDEGERATVTVEAQGDGLTYAWYYKSAGASKFTLTTSFTGNSYFVSMTESRDGREVYCVITDQYGDSVTTETVTLSMTKPTELKITQQPVSVAVDEGERATVTVTAEGDGLTYAWYYKSAGASKFTLTTSFTGNSYFVSMTESRDGRQVYCVITDQYGNTVTTDTVTLSIAKAELKITKQPVSVTVAEGERATVTVTAEGDGLTYAWYYKSAGASNFTLTTSFTSNSYFVSMTESRAGRQVYCVITDQYGNSVTTDTVTLNME